jgi:hypothetical protein
MKNNLYKLLTLIDFPIVKSKLPNKFIDQSGRPIFDLVPDKSFITDLLKHHYNKDNISPDIYYYLHNEKGVNLPSDINNVFNTNNLNRKPSDDIDTQGTPFCILIYNNGSRNNIVFIYQIIYNPDSRSYKFLLVAVFKDSYNSRQLL